ncbi:hypothetical protein Shyhy01_29430 [Streptomyces hygroscopicus subsp. hygroscopicus]|nr:hypothetical protein Shyhy01_29430 [Streptomyces hygroscopicus subsp. hygroscopicus]
MARSPRPPPGPRSEPPPARRAVPTRRTRTDAGEAVARLKRHGTGEPPYPRPGGAARTYVGPDAEVGYAVAVRPPGADVSRGPLTR